MFPIRDHNPSSGAPHVTMALTVINVTMLLLTVPWGGDMAGLWADLALYPVAVLHGVHLWGLVSHMFLHAGVLHLLGNMLFLWIFGDNLEERMGHVGFALFYLLCGLVAAGAQILAEPFSGIPMVGASGAIAGVMGGYLLLFPRARVDVVVIIVIFFKVVTLPAWLILGLWFGVQLVWGYHAPGGDAGVAYWAHTGGFLAGILLALPVFWRSGGKAFWARTSGRPPNPPVSYQPSRIPQVRR